jgi:hypothetical protein
LFAAVDSDKDGALTRDELKGTFSKWASEWGSGKGAALDEEVLRNGLSAALPRPNFAGPGGGRGQGSGNMPRVEGVKLDPLVAAGDPNKPLISKLLAVPALRTCYLGYVRSLAENWLDWNKLGPIAERYQSLIAADVKSDTRKLDGTEDFAKGVTEDLQGRGGFGGGGVIGLKNFADKRRAFLLDHAEVKAAK